MGFFHPAHTVQYNFSHCCSCSSFSGWFSYHAWTAVYNTSRYVCFSFDRIHELFKRVLMFVFQSCSFFTPSSAEMLFPFCLLVNRAASWVMTCSFQVMMQLINQCCSRFLWIALSRGLWVCYVWLAIEKLLFCLSLSSSSSSPPSSSGGGPALGRVPVQVLLSAPVEPPAHGPHGQQELSTKPCGTQGEHATLELWDKKPNSK